MTRRHTYCIADEIGGQYSADAADYWAARDGASMECALVRLDHPYRTTSGRTVYAPRVIKEHATVRDLRRIAGRNGWAGR